MSGNTPNGTTAAPRMRRRLVAAAAIATLGGGMAMAASPTHNHTVGTMQRVDTGQHRLVLSVDARTGSELGQGAPLNAYYDASTTVHGKPTPSDFKLGDRLLLQTSKSGNRVNVQSVTWLPDTTPGQGWGQYVHGRIGEIEDRTQTLLVDQAETQIRNRIVHDEGTRYFALDGSPMTLDQLKAGDDVDIAFRLQGRVRTATKVVLLEPSGGR